MSWQESLAAVPHKLAAVLHPDAPDMAALLSLYLRNLRRDRLTEAYDAFAIVAIGMIEASEHPSPVAYARDVYRKGFDL